MLSLRKIVAGPKIRTVENGYDLDLTYVTNRVIAMAFPAEGFEKLYRNSLNDVSDFLKKKHGGKYLVFNLSGRKYNYQKFNERVREFDWEDHQAPTLFTIFEICEKMKAYLESDGENVVVVHCNHGKGRTGTIIVCLLLFCNFFDYPEEALEFYSKRRFQKEGYGVTQPCQLRYIHYFYNLLVKKNVKIRAYSLKQIQFKGKGKVENCVCSVSNVQTKKKITKACEYKDGMMYTTEQNLLLGDIFFDFKIPGVLGIMEKSFARLNLNTIFIPPDLKVRLKVEDISPDCFLEKWKGVVGSDFEMEIVFEEYCECDLTANNSKNACGCLQEIRMNKQYWQQMHNILTNYELPSKLDSVLLMYGDQTSTYSPPTSKSTSVQKKKKDNSFSQQSYVPGRKATQ